MNYDDDTGPLKSRERSTAGKLSSLINNSYKEDENDNETKPSELGEPKEDIDQPKEEGRGKRKRLTFYKKKFKKDFSALFNGSLSSNTNTENEEDHKIFRIFHEKKEEEIPGISYISGTFWKLFEKKNRLGEGTSGVVRRCIRREDGKVFAVKVVRTRDDEIIFHLKNEFKNLSQIKHTNIVEAYELFIDFDHAKVYLLMEFIEGTEMFDYIVNTGFYTEENSKVLFKQLLEGIKFLHGRGVVHRDLKPNNILVSKDGKGLKITDFNVAKFFDGDYKNAKKLKKSELKMYTYTGTLAFSAPEIFDNDSYSEAVDVWSAGCVLYTMLCGFQPFYHEYVAQLTEMIKKGEYTMEGDPWDEISPEAKDLISKILVVESEERLSVEDCLKHKWFEQERQLPMHRKSTLSLMVINNFKSNVIKLCRKKHCCDETEGIEEEPAPKEKRKACFNSFLKNLTGTGRRNSFSLDEKESLGEETLNRYYPSKTFMIKKPGPQMPGLLKPRK